MSKRSIYHDFLRNLFLPLARPAIWLCCKKKQRKIVQTVLPGGGVVTQKRYEKLRFSTSISLYLGNNTKYGHSYNVGHKTNRNLYAIYRMAPFSMILSDVYSRFHDFRILQLQITLKWYKMELYLQWQIDRKSYVIYRILPFSMSKNDS